MLAQFGIPALQLCAFLLWSAFGDAPDRLGWPIFQPATWFVGFASDVKPCVPGSVRYIKRCKISYTFWCRGKERGLESHDALPGTTVRVRYVTRRTEFAGMWGTIEKCFGSPDHPALDVRLENGRLELFWFYQLDRAGET